jgi:hypothetical protein
MIMNARRLASLLLVLVAACDSDEPTSPRLQTAVAGLFTEGVSLEIGEVLTLTAGEAQAVFLNGGPSGAEYLYVPFNASEVATQNLAVEVVAGNVQPPSLSANSSRIPTGLPGVAPGSEPQVDWTFHERLREREIRELTALIGPPGAGALNRVPEQNASGVAQAVPNVGDQITLNASTQPCSAPNPRTGRVAAVTDRAIVVEDIANPTGGFTDAEFRSVGITFDTLIYPVDTRNFGEPTDIDNNNRVIIFYTRAVNELTAPNSRSFVGGFFFGRDLFPRQRTDRLEACPTSNEAEIMYLLAPDPTGEVNGNVRTKEFVFRTTLGTVAHELQHLINASRRIFINNAASFEEVWLNEGLSHIAEELMFYAVTPLQPRQNIDLETLRSSPQILQAVNTYQTSNLARYNTYLEEPDTASLLGIDNLPTRGASWAFLRYVADLESGPDATFFFRLVNATGSGVANLTSVLGVNAIDLMQTWTVSVFTDDAVRVVPPRYTQPSWNFRSIIPALNEGVFPLEVRSLRADAETKLNLRGGGAAFVRFGVAPGQQAVLTTTSGGAVPPQRLRISIVRLR